MPTEPSGSQKRHFSGASSAPARPQVLVVDDDVTIRVLVRHILEEAGYRVTEAESGRDALLRLRSGPLPDHLITDLKMADGRTVVMTGDATGAAAAHVAARWHCPVLAKPLRGPDLLDALRREDDTSTDR